MGNERLAAFIFLLARERIGFGYIEEFVRRVEEAHPIQEHVNYLDDAEPLGDWARRIADRLTGTEGDALEAAARRLLAALGGNQKAGAVKTCAAELEDVLRGPV